MTMCGIAGILSREEPVSARDAAAVRRMMAAQTHRGPDDEALHQQGAVVLGHRRLKVIDLSDAGRQPMSNRERTIWVLHNGEIYNFGELRQELVGQGYSFRSRTDTEVLVHGYLAWGVERLLSRLRGMFAFVLYDGRFPESPSLVLARDRFGIKPLYYYCDSERWVFASEVQALLMSGMIVDDENPEALIRFLQLGSVPKPLTTVKKVLAVPAGHYILVGLRHSVLKQYWALNSLLERSESRETRNPATAPPRTRTMLEESTRLHLVSDVPLGVFLSGGIDSSALVVLASRFRESSLTTLSVVFEEPEWSEALHARRVAQIYRTEHHEVLVRSADFFQSLPKIFRVMDQPTVDGVNTYFVSQAAREVGLTVVLSGAGADELFLGYPHFQNATALTLLFSLLRFVPFRGAVIRIMGKAGALAGRSGLDKLAYLNGPTVDSSYMFFRGLFSPSQIQDLLGIGEKELQAFGPAVPPIPGDARESAVSRLSLMELTCYLQNQLLTDTDFMSMAHSIETRVPFLDHPLVEFVFALPTEIKLERRTPKPLLLKAVREGLPREVWDRPKKGFTFPFARWLRERPQELRERSLDQHLFRRCEVESVWKAFLAGRVHWSRVWALVVLSELEAKRGRRHVALE